MTQLALTRFEKKEKKKEKKGRERERKRDVSATGRGSVERNRQTLN